MVSSSRLPSIGDRIDALKSSFSTMQEKQAGEQSPGERKRNEIVSLEKQTLT